MAERERWWGLGKSIAPPRFVLFLVVLAIALPIGIANHGWNSGVMAAFDLAAIVFLIAVATLLKRSEADRMRAAAKANDANRAMLLGFTAIVMIVILVAVAGELRGRPDPGTVALVIATLALAWLFSNTVYALHYAHLYYLEGENGEDARGLDFPKCDEPDYWDFLYFSFTLGMTFQTSDVSIETRPLRRVAIGQCLAAFVFNLGVLAFTINVLGS